MSKKDFVPLLEKQFCKIHSPFETQMCGQFNNDCLMALHYDDVVASVKEFDKLVQKLFMHTCGGEGFCRVCEYYTKLMKIRKEVFVEVEE